LLKIGLNLGIQDNKPAGIVKDTLLAQLIAFCLTNKLQVKRYQVDFEKEVMMRAKEKAQNKVAKKF